MDAPVAACRAVYQGDKALETLLAKTAGRRLPPMAVAVRALVAGVLAAPDDVDRQAWHRLVAADPSPALAAQLDALAAEMRAAGAANDGIVDEVLPVSERLARLRDALRVLGVDGFIVPRADEHQGEYVPLAARRLTWISNFTGSAGVAIVLPEVAAIFVDGRYTLQARAEVEAGSYCIHHLTGRPPHDWLSVNLQPGQRFGYDPWLHTAEDVTRLREACDKAKAVLVALPGNPIDAVWQRRPPQPLAPVVPLDHAFTGRGSLEKRSELAAGLSAAGAQAVVLTLPDSIAWLLNVRGGDVAYAPLPLSFAILHADGTVGWFVDSRKLSPGLEAHCGAGVRIMARDDFAAALDALGREGRKVQVDPSSAPAWVTDRLTAAGATVARAPDPCVEPKACKNAVELDGIRAAHRRDGAAMVRFFAWFAAEAPRGRLSEISAADKLEEFRSAGEHFRGLSFPTIAGAGPDGAIVHYRAMPDTDRRIEPGMVLLLDSGAQYLDGTTDVTRTVFVGGGAPPAAEVKDAFTRVLKGHIALSMARFPAGTSGSQLDVLARLSLWQAGLDYDHGTGHGVGHYLNVHEGPHRISKVPNRQALKPGMVVSNEPGYYKTGAFGIRIENLIAVRPVTGNEGGLSMLQFEPLTLVPIDRHLIEVPLFTAEERCWLDAYHARVRDLLTPTLDRASAAWLAEATRPLEA